MVALFQKGGRLMETCREVEKIPWMPHPVLKEIGVKPLITKKDLGLDVTCMLVRVPAGQEVPEHVHETQDDILYPLEGHATMWVDGTGTFPLRPGVIVRVPVNTKHRIYDVKESLLVYDVFCPALM
jgi:quercetin dioxygenase-like cupin family protein